MVRLPVCIIGALAILATAQSALAEPEVTAFVDTASVSVGQIFALTISATGGSIEDIALPECEGIEFNARPSSSISIQQQIVNGRVQASQKHELIYSAWTTREGTLQIPPVTVLVEGREFLTKAIVIRSKDAKATVARPRGTPRAAASGQTTQAEVATDQNPTLEDILLVETEVNKHEAYQGEAIALTLRILQLDNPNAAASYEGGRGISLPSTEGFYQGPVFEARTRGVRNGWDYRIHEIKQSLFPTESGVLSIGAWTWTGRVRGYVGGRVPQELRVQPQSPPIEIQVKPLPPSPPGFSGAVGRFTLEVALGQEDLLQGVPVPLAVQITGWGNPNAIGLPLLPRLEWAHLSAPEIEVQHLEEEKDWSHVRKTYTYSLTPLGEGIQSLPPIEHVYFSPGAGKYETSSTSEIPVEVRSTGQHEDMVVVGGVGRGARGDVEILGDDLMPILGEATLSRPTPIHPVTGGIAFFLPPAGFVLFAGFMRHRRRLEEDEAYARTYFARARSQKRLGQVLSAKDPGEELYRVLSEYLADKFNVNGAGMTSHDARVLLEKHAIDTDLTESLVKVLRTCERKRYGGVALQAAEVQPLIDGVTQAMDRLEEIRKKDLKS